MVIESEAEYWTSRNRNRIRRPERDTGDGSVDAQRTIRKAYEITKSQRWLGCRSEENSSKVAEEIVAFFEARGIVNFDDLTSADVAALVETWRAVGNMNSTMKGKLSKLKTMCNIAKEQVPRLASRGVPIYRFPKIRRLKWWLTPEARVELLAYLRDELGRHIPADCIEFICFTGCRVEEALKLRQSHFSGLDTDKPTWTVPGTKTDNSQRTLALSNIAANIARRRIGEIMEVGPQSCPTCGRAYPIDHDARLFQVSYAEMKRLWARRCRPFLGVPATVQTCTLKALRRSFAAMATSNGMPTERLQHYLRHRKIETTIGYLELVGTHDIEEARKWL
jgi:integrase